MMQDVAKQATGRIITHHISPYHAVQGPEDEVRQIVGRLPGDPPAYLHRCEDCLRKIGEPHQGWCPEGSGDDPVRYSQTFSGSPMPFKSSR